VTKRELVLKISEQTGIRQNDVMAAVQSFLDNLIISLENGHKIELRNFGIFKVKTRKPKRARNPKTGQEVPIPERKVVTFKPGMVMKAKIK